MIKLFERKWEKHEDLLLTAIAGHFGSKLNPLIVQLEFKDRSLQACQERWYENQIYPPDPPGSEPSVITHGMIGILPYDWEDLPLLPLLQVCHHLDYKHVFGVLPLVCRNFRNLLARRTIFLKKLELDPNVSAMTLIMLGKRIAGCHFLDIKATAKPYGAFYRGLTSQLLKGLQHSVEIFHCTTTTQQPITEFINSCPKLKILNIRLYDVINDWDWDQHKIHPSIIELTLGSWVSNPSASLEKMMKKVPFLTKFIWDDDWPSLFIEDDKIRPLVPSRIIHYEGPYVMPIRFLWPTKILRLVILEVDVMEQATRLIPNLKFLQKLIIQASELVLSKLSSDDPNNCISKFINAVKTCQPLRAIAVGRTPRLGSAGEIFDLELEGLLHELPIYIEHIQYKGKLLRYPNHDPQFVIENRNQMFAAIMNTAFFN